MKTISIAPAEPFSATSTYRRDRRRYRQPSRITACNAAAPVRLIVAASEPAQRPSLAFVGRLERSDRRAKQARLAAHLDFLRRWFRRQILVEQARLSLRDVLLGKPAHHNLLRPAHRPPNLQRIARSQPAIWLGGLPVDRYLAGLARRLGVRARFEEARDV